VAQKPRDAVVNFLSKFTAASRGPPCDSTALVLHCNINNSHRIQTIHEVMEMH